MRRLSLYGLFIVLSGCGLPAFGFDFVPGQFLTTAGFLAPDYPTRTIRRYSTSGQYLDALSLPGGAGSPDTAHGLTFGPDGLLYVASIDYSATEVVAIHRTGVVVKRYTAAPGYGGSAASGKIAFATDGNFYVTTGQHILKFSTNSSTGSPIYTDSVEALAPLPSGNLLVLTRFTLTEITTSGAVVRTITPGVRLYDALALAYDGQTNTIYIGMLSNPQVVRIAATDGVVLQQASVHDPFDIRISSARSVIVTDRNEESRILDMTLQRIGALEGAPQLFVTETPPGLPLPEPCSLDVDGNTKIEYASDGLLILRAMLGLSDTALVANAIGSSPARRSTASEIRQFLRNNCGLQIP